MFFGDPHGHFEFVIGSVQTHRPAAVALLGDVQAHRPLEIELAPILALTAVWFIHGNHDTDSDADQESWTVPGARRSSMSLEVGQHEKSARLFATSTTTRMRSPGCTESSRAPLSSSRSSDSAMAASFARRFAPRDGEGVRMKKVVLADQDRAELYYGTVREFFRKVLDMDYDECVVTDESRLGDFSSCGL